MAQLFRNSSPGALSRKQAVALEKERQGDRERARALAAQGRGSDTEIAHVARGELVIPFALQNPEVLSALHRAASAHNIPLEMLSVGNIKNHINPNTGAAEFGIGDWLSGLFGSSAPQPGNATTPPQPVPAPGHSPALDQNQMPKLESLPRAEAYMSLPPNQKAQMDTALKAQQVYGQRLVDLTNPHVMAWLDTLPETEGADYNTMVGGKEFTNLSQYPGKASGAYQITGDTYKDIAPKVGTNDYSPLTQDILAIQNMAEKCALEAVKRGDFNGALRGMSRGWASIPDVPGSNYETGYYNTSAGHYQRAKPYNEVQAIYERNLKKYLQP